MFFIEGKNPMSSLRKSIVGTLALAAFVTGGAALAAGTAAAAVPADREVGITTVTGADGGTDPHLIQVASDPDSSMSGEVSTNGTRINF